MVGNSEKLKTNGEHDSNVEALQQVGLERHEALQEQLERAGEQQPQEKLENIKREALEKAKSLEKIAEKQERQASPAERRKDGPFKKAERDASYKQTMKQVRSEMNTPSRAFSKVIHAKPIEKTSELIGGTVARPNAILSGAIGAFVFTLIIYLMAKYYGYPLSGFESIAGFAVGWAVGLLFDYLKIEITGRR